MSHADLYIRWLREQAKASADRGAAHPINSYDFACHASRAAALEEAERKYVEIKGGR